MPLMVLAALALFVLDQGTSVGAVRALVPPDLRPPELPSAIDNGWTLALHASGRSGSGWTTAKELETRAFEMAAKDLQAWSRKGGAKRPPTATKPRISDFLTKWPDVPSPEFLKGAHEALAPYRERFRYLEAAVVRPVWAPPRFADTFRPSLDEVEVDFETDAGLKELAKALSLRAHVNAAEGRPEAAVADVTLIRRMGNRLAGGYTPIIAYLVGISIEAIGDRAATGIAMSTHLRDEHLAALQAVVAESPRPERLEDTLRNEFDNHFVRMVAAVPTDARDLEQLEGVPPSLARAIRGRPVFNRKDTIDEAASLYRVAFENRSRPWSGQVDVERLIEARAPKYPDVAEPKPGQDLSRADAQRVAHWIRANPNVVGRQFVSFLGSSTGQLERTERQADARRRLTLAAIAVRRAMLRSGQPPASLQALVEAGLLTELPHDPFGDGALLYDPVRKVVWSVGADGRDDGGKNRPNTSKPDLVIAVP